MNIQKAVITAAAPNQRELPVQTLIDKDGQRKSVLEILVSEVNTAGISDVLIVVHPGDEIIYQQALKQSGCKVSFIAQKQALGYGHALYCAKDFIKNEPFLHLVGDHLYVDQGNIPCAKQLIDLAKKQDCSVSAVQPTRESLITNFGVVGGTGFQRTNFVYQVDRVMEKPTPTIAEQQLTVPGLRAGHYLCFFGMHVLTPSVMDILGHELNNSADKQVNLSFVLNILAKKEQYLALEINDQRYDLGDKYGLLKAQLALAMNGKDRNRILSEILELFITQDLSVRGK